MLDIIKDTNQERKLTPSEKNKLSDVLVDIGREKRTLANNKTDIETKSAQCRYEESIGADKIKNQIKQKCAEINELNVQLLESACKPINADDRITSYRWDTEPSKINLKGDKLKKYKEHRKMLDSLEKQNEGDYESIIKVQAILSIETVGEAIKFIEKIDGSLLDYQPTPAIEG
tara:strand:+ start:145 stop:666 length:522 start_codon:yes stop_codon:yes gene_type:complete